MEGAKKREGAEKISGLRGQSKSGMVEIGASFVDKVAAAVDDNGADVGVDRDEIGPWPVEPLPEPPDDAGPVGWPMPEFCPLTFDGAVKDSFLETLRKDAGAEQQLQREAEALSPDSRPSSSKRQRAGTGSPPSSRSPFLEVFQQCKQDVV